MIVHDPRDHPYVAAFAIAFRVDRRCSGHLGCMAGHAAVAARGKGAREELKCDHAMRYAAIEIEAPERSDRLALRAPS